MVVKQMKPGSVEVSVVAQSKTVVAPKQITDLPGGLYPLHSAAFEMDEYRIMAGWPVPVPDYDIRVATLMSADGTELTDRDPPTSLTTGATYRWIADDNYWDTTSLRWAPIQGDCPPWSAFPGNDPTLLTNYEYVIGDERFTERTVLNFDSDTGDYLANDMSLSMGGIGGFTIILVMSPSSAYGNNPGVPANGILGPSSTSGQWFSVEARGDYLWLDSESMNPARGVSIGHGQRSTAPLFLALCLGTPQAVMIAASGPSSLLSKGIPTGTEEKVLRTDFWLGRTGLTPGTADMALMDLGIYGDVLSSTQVAHEFALLSSIYGGDS